MSESTQKLTDANFDSTIETADKPVLVDFWAEWCGPCRMVAPILEEIAKENKEKLIVAKVNVDENPGVSGRLGIRSIPTMNIYKSGQLVISIVGAKSKHDLLADLTGII